MADINCRIYNTDINDLSDQLHIIEQITQEINKGEISRDADLDLRKLDALRKQVAAEISKEKEKNPEMDPESFQTLWNRVDRK